MDMLVIREAPMSRPAPSSMGRMYSSSGRVAAAVATAEVPVALASEPAEGCLVEYQRDGKSGLALVTKRDGKRNWTAVDTR